MCRVLCLPPEQSAGTCSSNSYTHELVRIHSGLAPTCLGYRVILTPTPLVLASCAQEGVLSLIRYCRGQMLEIVPVPSMSFDFHSSASGFRTRRGPPSSLRSRDLGASMLLVFTRLRGPVRRLRLRRPGNPLRSVCLGHRRSARTGIPPGATRLRGWSAAHDIRPVRAGGQGRIVVGARHGLLHARRGPPCALALRGIALRCVDGVVGEVWVSSQRFLDFGNGGPPEG